MKKYRDEDEEELDPLNFPAESGESEIADDTKEDDSEQLSLISGFELQEQWQEEWQDMPEFIQEDLMPWRTLYVHFEEMSDVIDFSKLVGQKLTESTRYIWHPKVEPMKSSDYRYVDEP